MDMLCLRCKAVLAYCDSDAGPDWLYCEGCMDVAYDPDSGEVIGELT